MPSRIPKYVLRAGVDALHTWSDWMNSGDDEGMEAHRLALTALQEALWRDPAVTNYLRDEEILAYLRSDVAAADEAAFKVGR